MQSRVQHLIYIGAFTRQNDLENGLPKRAKLEDCVATELDSWIKLQGLEHAVTVPTTTIHRRNDLHGLEYVNFP